MNTHAISYTPTSVRTRDNKLFPATETLTALRRLAQLTLAGATALAVIIAGIWAATNPSAAQFLGAGLWASSFIFFALALEVNIKRVFPLIITGLALPALAILGSRVAEEFSILAVVTVAAWLAIWIGRRG